MITCKICGREFHAITKRHLVHHGLTRDQYLEKFPDAPMQSEESAAKRSAAKKDMSEAARERKEAKKSKKLTKRIPWNFGKSGYKNEWSDEARQRVAARDNHLKGKTLSEETKEKIRKKVTGQKITPEQKEKHRIAMEKIRSAPDFVGGMKGKKHTAEVKQKISNNSKQKAAQIRKTQEERGYWIPLDQISEFEIYRRKVRAVTEKNVCYISNYDASKRGLNDRQIDNFQVDHKLSIYEGFMRQIAPEIIGHHCNLQFIPWRENNGKWHRSSITLEELMSEIQKLKKGS
jgi:hypothetical protein